MLSYGKYGMLIRFNPVTLEFIEFVEPLDILGMDPEIEKRLTVYTADPVTGTIKKR